MAPTGRDWSCRSQARTAPNDANHMRSSSPSPASARRTTGGREEGIHEKLAVPRIPREGAEPLLSCDTHVAHDHSVKPSSASQKMSKLTRGSCSESLATSSV